MEQSLILQTFGKQQWSDIGSDTSTWSWYLLPAVGYAWCAHGETCMHVLCFVWALLTLYNHLSLDRFLLISACLYIDSWINPCIQEENHAHHECAMDEKIAVSSYDTPAQACFGGWFWSHTVIHMFKPCDSICQPFQGATLQTSTPQVHQNGEEISRFEGCDESCSGLTVCVFYTILIQSCIAKLQSTLVPTFRTVRLGRRIWPNRKFIQCSLLTRWLNRTNQNGLIVKCETFLPVGFCHCPKIFFSMPSLLIWGGWAFPRVLGEEANDDAGSITPGCWPIIWRCWCLRFW